MSEIKEAGRKYWRVIVLALILIPLLCLIVTYLREVANVLLALLGFGTVIIVHEIGHFVAAKLGGIKIEVFSIFMSPILLGIRRTQGGIRFRILPGILPKEDDESGEGALSFTVGSKGAPSETEYRVGLVPFGGYVKMLGQHDAGPALESDDPRSFLNKPLGTRLAVLAAGVTCNVISAVIIFMIVFLVGIGLTPAVVGDVIPGSPAANAGLKAGDEIIEIAGRDGSLDFSEIVVGAALSGRDEEVPMTVRRADGSKEEIKLVAEERPDEPMRSFGILPPGSLHIADISRGSGKALRASTELMPGDCVEAMNGKPITASWELSQIVADTYAPYVTLSVERKSKGRIRKVESRLRTVYSPVNDPNGGLSHVHSMVPRLRIEKLLDNYDPPADEIASRLVNGDIILAIGEVENPTFDEMRNVTTEHKDKELIMKVLREDADGAEQELAVTVIPRQQKGTDRVMIGFITALDMKRPVVAATIAREGGPAKLGIPRGAAIIAIHGTAVADFYDVTREIKRHSGQRIAIDWQLDAEVAGSVEADVQSNSESIALAAGLSDQITFDLLERKFKASGPVDAVVMGCRRTVMFAAQTYVTLRRLVGGLVSPKNLMGPLGIISTSYKIVDKKPLIYYLYFLGLINAIIAVFNFLPLPPLDGGLAALLLIEKVRGAAFSKRIQTAIAYTGWILILALFFYVTFNDILRTFFGRAF